MVRDYVVETLASPDAVLVIDETGFLKQGKASCGVGRQYTGSVGKITNCQIEVFAAYVSDQRHAFIDRRLYLPKAWTGDPARMRAAHVPEAITFATKPQLALAMIERALQTEVPFAWVAADSIYGVGDIELALRRAYKGYVLGVTGQHRFWSWDQTLDVAGTAEAIAKGIPDQDWLRLSAGAGTKGARLFDWAYLSLATLRADALDASLDQSLWTRGLLVRRSLSDGALSYFTTWCPAGTSIERLVMVEGWRWAIEDAFETAKTELGPTHNESRSWHGWHRHVSLVMLAFAMLARVRRGVLRAHPDRACALLGQRRVVDHKVGVRPAQERVGLGQEFGFERSGIPGGRRDEGVQTDLTGWLWTGLIERISQDRRSWT